MFLVDDRHLFSTYFKIQLKAQLANNEAKQFSIQAIENK